MTIYMRYSYQIAPVYGRRWGECVSKAEGYEEVYILISLV